MGHVYVQVHARVISSGVIYLIMILNIRNSNSWCVYPDLSVLTSLAFFFSSRRRIQHHRFNCQLWCLAAQAIGKLTESKVQSSKQTWMALWRGWGESTWWLEAPAAACTQITVKAALTGVEKHWIYWECVGSALGEGGRGYTEGTWREDGALSTGILPTDYTQTAKVPLENSGS